MAYNQAQKYEKAIEYFEKCLTILEGTGDKKSQNILASTIYGNIAIAYENQG